MNSRLSPQIVALIHQSELNKAGWFDAHKKHAISALFWLENRHLTPNDILTNQEEVGLTGLSLLEATNLLNILCTEDVLLQLNDESYRLTQNAHDMITKQVESAEKLEHDVISQFRDLLERDFQSYLSIDAEKLWEIFRRGFLAPFIEFFGARTYEILTGNTTDIDRAPFVLQFLNRFSIDEQPYIRQLFEAFLDSSSGNFRSYTLRLLNSHFFSIANRYRRENLEALYGDRHRPVIRCVLDTNFLYSVLDLHENPSNEAANALLETIYKARNYIDFRLYVFPPTVDELRRSLLNHEDMLSQILVTRNISEAAIHGAVSGVTLKFIRECQQSGYSLTAKDYFEPYHNNLTQILAEKGIRLFNEKTEHYSSDQRVIDDALDQQSFFIQRHRNRQMRGKPKTYDQIWHDMLLWYFISDKRPAHVDSIVNVDAIGVTIDYSLLGFDSYKRRREQSSIPVFIHPATLIQLLQFFVPVDEDFEAAIVDTLRMPFLLREFDSDSEKTTVRILARLSRFENIFDLSPSTIRHVLQNEILRNKLEDEVGDEGEIQVIREALIEENARAQAELADAKRREDELLGRVTALAGVTVEDKRAISDLSTAVERESKDKERLAEEIDAMRQQAAKRMIEAERNAARANFLTQFIRWPAVLGLVGFVFLLGRYDNQFGVEDLFLYSVPILTVILSWLAVILWAGSSKRHVRDWWWFQKLNATKYTMGMLALTVLGGLWATAYWDSIKEFIGKSQ